MPNRITVSKEWFDVLIIVPLEEELLTLMEVFPLTVNRSTERTFRYEIDVDHKNLRALVVQQEGMGRTHAARAVSEALFEFDAGLVVCLGIAGALIVLPGAGCGRPPPHSITLSFARATYRLASTATCERARAWIRKPLFLCWQSCSSPE
jgi:hypothetical protein